MLYNVPKIMFTGAGALLLLTVNLWLLGFTAVQGTEADPAMSAAPTLRNLATSRVGQTTVNWPTAVNRRILMFVAYNDVWWAEYKVVYEALQAQGYTVEVRSSGTGEALSYGSRVDATPSGAGLDPTYPAPAGHAEFRDLFAANFGVAWDEAWNAPQSIPLNGRIQDVTSLDQYDALVIPGGRGAVAYRYDGAYADLSPQNAPGAHVATAAEVQAAAEQLNLLISLALAAGKPVGAECHAAPLVAFARLPDTVGEGFDGLGQSILASGYATGYPFANGDTAASYANLGITLLDREKVVLDGPESPAFAGSGRDRVVTSADWYPTSAAYLARTLLNMVETYPTPAQHAQPVQVLVFGGDEPTNYAPQQPARYTDLVTLLNDAGDALAITATGTNQLADMNPANLQQYDILLYFRHNQIPQAAQAAIRDYVDGGGGLVAIHHAIFNHQNGKGTLIDLIGGELPQGVSPNNGLVYTGESNHLINVNLGHFVSTYGVPAAITQTVEYTTPLGLPNANLDQDGTRGYYSFRIEAPDELYLASRFNPGVTFGRGVNEINRLFANDRFIVGSPNPNNGHYDTWGWTRLYDGNGDGTRGRIVYLQPGETNERTLSQPAYRQVIKNAVIWAALEPESIPPTPTPTPMPTPTPIMTPAHTTIEISSTVRLTGTKRLGMNLGSHNEFGAAQLLKNVIRNPGFEAGEYGMIFLALPNATSSRVQASLWNTTWNSDTARIGQPVDFWNGDEYEIVTGPAAGHSGTITNFTHENNRYTFYLGDAGLAPLEGNVFIVRQQRSGYYSDTQEFNAADPDHTRPGSPGAQSLRLTAPAQSGPPSWRYAMDSSWRDGDRSSGKLLIADGDWHFEIWARAENAGDTLAIQFLRERSSDFFTETITLSTTWQHIVRDFTVEVGRDAVGPFAPDAYHPILLLNLHLSANSGDVWVDDIALSRSGQSNPTVFTDKLVARLQELKPGLLRNWGMQQLGSTLDNQLAVPWARRTNNYTPERRVATNYHYSIHEFLQLAALIGAEPWYVIPPSFSSADLQNLVAYLAAPPGTHPYANIRVDLGQIAPWTEVFTTTHLELGNEMWGGISRTNPFLGASVGGPRIDNVTGGERLGQVADNRFAMIRSSPFFAEDEFNLIIGSQAAVPTRTLEIDSHSNHHDTIALAPYFYFGDEEGAAWNSAEEIYYPLFAWPHQDVQPAGRVGAAQRHLATRGQGTELAIYEINFHTTAPGAVPIDVRNDFVTSLGGGLALPLFMLTYQHDMKIRNQNVWQVTSFSNPVGNTGQYVRVFGTLRDLEATGRKRPTWLGVELANRAIRGDLLETRIEHGPAISIQPPINGITGTVPITVPLIRAFAYRDGDEYAVMVFNLDLTTAHTVTLQLPTPPQVSATLHTLTADTIDANNEEAENVSIQTSQINNFGPTYDLILAPHSAYVLTWQVGAPQQTIYLPIVSK